MYSFWSTGFPAVPPHALHVEDVNLGDQHIHPAGFYAQSSFGVPSLACGPVNNHSPLRFPIMDLLCHRQCTHLTGVATRLAFPRGDYKAKSPPIAGNEREISNPQGTPLSIESACQRNV